MMRTLAFMALCTASCLADEAEDRTALFEQRSEINGRYTREGVELAENERIIELEREVGRRYEELLRAVQESDDTRLKRLFLNYEWSVDLLTAEQDLLWTQEDGDKLGRIKARADVAKANYALKRIAELFGAGAGAESAEERKDSSESKSRKGSEGEE